MNRTSLTLKLNGTGLSGLAWFTFAFLWHGTVWSASPSHCISTEKTFFSCPIVESNKVVSLCGGGTDTNPVTWVQYRFGKLSAPEMIYPKDKADSLNVFGGWFETHAWHHSLAEVWFSVGAYSYRIERNSSMDEDKPDAPWHSDHFVVVFRSGKPVASLVCKEPATDDLSSLGEYISDDQTKRP